MSYDEAGTNKVPGAPEIPHYHGDKTRIIFVISAVLLIVGQSTGAELPISTVTAVIWAVVLVIAGGVTNSTQHGIHWFNALLALLGTLVFGISAVNHFRDGATLANTSFFYIEALALLSLIALYLTTRTIRSKLLGLMTR